MQPFQIHVTVKVLDDLRVRLRHTRWPDQLPGIGWEQGTEQDWLRRLVSYWADTFDWRTWERKFNTLHHFTWEGIHFVHQRRGIRPGSTADPHPRLARQFSRLYRHAADA